MRHIVETLAVDYAKYVKWDGAVKLGSTIFERYVINTELFDIPGQVFFDVTENILTNLGLPIQFTCVSKYYAGSFIYSDGRECKIVFRRNNLELLIEATQYDNKGNLFDHYLYD